MAPQRYASTHQADHFVSDSPVQPSRYGEFVGEILALADVDIDFAQFDNDGPDGMPDSGDDDGVVDMVVVITPRLPPNFLVGAATGIANLGFDGDFATQDPGPRTQGATVNRSGSSANEASPARVPLSTVWSAPWPTRWGTPLAKLPEPLQRHHGDHLRRL